MKSLLFAELTHKPEDEFMYPNSGSDDDEPLPTVERTKGWDRDGGPPLPRNFASEAKAASDADLSSMLSRLERAADGFTKPPSVLLAQLRAVRLEVCRRRAGNL